jgi:chemotaxis protein MotB
MLHDTDRQGMFMRGSALPTVRFSNLLRKMGPLFAQMENQMLVVGHTDSLQYTQTGSHGGFSNWTLSSMRAMAARDKLLEGGMRSDSVLQVVGMAERAPLDAAHATASVNRRIELLILTRSQAASVAAMFGMPGPTKPLAPGASTTVTGAKTDDRADAGALAELRQKLAK